MEYGSLVCKPVSRIFPPLFAAICSLLHLPVGLKVKGTVLLSLVAVAILQ